jgi:hypothetical protein
MQLALQPPTTDVGHYNKNCERSRFCRALCRTPRNTLDTALDTALYEQSGRVCNRLHQSPATGRIRIA